MVKRRFRLLLATVMTIALIAAGCSSGKGSNSNSGTQGSANKPAASSNGGQAGEEPAAKPPVKISIMANLHTAEVPSDKIEKLVEEATNTDLDIQWVPDGSYDEKMNASFATGTL